ncbi:MAG: hypothetical protein CMG35_01255 [Candidatus Marinimicrobia bacterium]|nr:hypothetical protein [Candidatus Neomarinimicrobiota bacterium]|tara:strand:- start:158 stop:820 length:663 start_codon:yes stop_codon:yes gene_type:complete
MIPNYFIIDFDSTFISKESLDELASYSLRKSKTKNIILNKIHTLTNDGMNGKITFYDSIKTRLKLINATKNDVLVVSNNLKSHVTHSFKRNKNFIKKYSNRIYIISGGFKEMLVPVLADFGIQESNIFGNEFIYDGDKIIGFNTNNPLAKIDGKSQIVESLKLDGEIHCIGDGYNDFQLKLLGSVSKFIAFTENVYRNEVCNVADKVISSLDEYIDFLND